MDHHTWGDVLNPHLGLFPRCDGEIASKTREVGESGDEIQLLQASIESGEAAVAAHEEKLQGVLAEMAKWSAQKEMLGEHMVRSCGTCGSRVEPFLDEPCFGENRV